MISLRQIYYRFSLILSKLQKSVFFKIRMSKKKDSLISTLIILIINPISLKKLSKNQTDKKLKTPKSESQSTKNKSKETLSPTFSSKISTVA